MRIIGDDQPANEVFISQSSGPRSRAVLERLLNGPSPEEVERNRELAAEREAARIVQLDLALCLHAFLLQAHNANPLVLALLSAHGPHELKSEQGRRRLECHGCPEGHDEDGPYRQSWPCPTWTLISNHTP